MTLASSAFRAFPNAPFCSFSSIAFLHPACTPLSRPERLADTRRRGVPASPDPGRSPGVLPAPALSWCPARPGRYPGILLAPTALLVSCSPRPLSWCPARPGRSPGVLLAPAALLVSCSPRPLSWCPACPDHSPSLSKSREYCLPMVCVCDISVMCDLTRVYIDDVL